MRRDAWQQIFGTRLGTATNAYVNNKMQTISNIFSLTADDAKQKIAFNLFRWRYVLQVACSCSTYLFCDSACQKEAKNITYHVDLLGAFQKAWMEPKRRCHIRGKRYVQLRDYDYVAKNLISTIDWPAVL